MSPEEGKDEQSSEEEKGIPTEKKKLCDSTNGKGKSYPLVW